MNGQNSSFIWHWLEARLRQKGESSVSLWSHHHKISVRGDTVRGEDFCSQKFIFEASFLTTHFSLFPFATIFRTIFYFLPLLLYTFQAD